MNDTTNSKETSKLSVLIVDDNPQYSGLLSRILKGDFSFSDITIVDNTDAAYDLIQDHPNQHRLLFVDFNFPFGASGGDLLTKLATDHLLEGKAAFLVTSEPSLENVEKAYKAGALGVVAKPFDRVDLAKQLERAERKLFADSIEFF